jgi:hypothetical protein
MKEPGRNDPCPCGSGKKYKKCCYPDRTRAWRTAGSHDGPALVIKTVKTPEPITHHSVSSDGGRTWRPRPGLLAARLVGKEIKDVDEAVANAMAPIYKGVDGLNVVDGAKQELRQRLGDVDHKLHAVKYHLGNYERAEEERVAQFGHDYSPPTGVQMTTEEPKLIYEVEAFLFQTKSCLDVLSRALKPVFGFRHCSFGDEGDVLIRQLKNNCPQGLVKHAQRFVKLIEDAQVEWVAELVKMRDEVTHVCRLEGFTCFVKDPYVGGGTASIHYPTMPNTRRALEYCRDVWQKLLRFSQAFLTLTLEAATAQPST